MPNWHVVLMVVVYLLIVGGIHAIASEEFESPGGKVVKIESLKELVLLMSKIDLSETNPVYMMIPILTDSPQDEAHSDTISKEGGVSCGTSCGNASCTDKCPCNTNKLGRWSCCGDNDCCPTGCTNYNCTRDFGKPPAHRWLVNKCCTGSCS